MLRSLEIRNYRNLRHLTIEKLGRVNLLVGKNNTGKTSVLEAIAIHINKGDIRTVLQLLDARGENYVYDRENARRENVRNTDGRYSDETDALKTLNALFIDREDDGSKLIIKSKSQIPFLKGELDDLWHETYLQVVRELNTSDSQYVKSGKFSVIPEHDLNEMIPIGLIIGHDNKQEIIPVSFGRLSRVYTSMLFEGVGKSTNYQFIRTGNVEEHIVADLWDRTALTWRENELIKALKIIDDKIERISFISGNRRSRVAVVKLQESENVVPLRSMGDGVNRILSIILAMLDCHFGYLLIDEFENGLHYSVQEKLWEVIFYLAERLNIQVFATTHSLDCVEAFSTVLNDGKQNKNAGVMIRLENYEGNIEATVYDADEIQATTRVHVDPR